jgi:fatty acid desaturase
MADQDPAVVDGGNRLRYPVPSLLNITILFVHLSAAVALLVFASHSTSGWLLAGCALLFALDMQLGFCLIHEAEHNKLHSNHSLNEALGTVLCAFFPASYHFLKVAHLSHHGRNRSDAELVDYIRPGEKTWLKRAQYYLLICGLFWLLVPVTSLVLCFVPGKAIAKRASRPGDKIFAMFSRFLSGVRLSRVRLEVGLAVVLWVALFQLFDLRPAAVAWCYAAFAFFWANQQYIYHVRTPRHVIEGAFDLRLWRPLQRLYLNFNFHLTHHRAVSVPWIYLPRVAEAPPTRGYLATYLGLWSPPRPISEAWPAEHQANGPLPERPSVG